MKHPYLYFLVVCSLFAVGCQRAFEYDIDFVNKSGKELAWVSVSGFKRQPGVGILIDGASKKSRMKPMPVPGVVTITWRLEGGVDRDSVISLAAVPPKARDGELRFEFTKSNEWIFTYTAPPK